MQDWSKEVLENFIIDTNKAYYAGDSIVTDSKYDEAVELLKSKYPESDLLKSGVLKQVKIERKVKLPVRMTSLDKFKSVEETLAWCGQYPEDSVYVLMAKLDGISLLTEHTKCWTRGDGEVGQKSDNFYKEMNPQYSFFMTIGEAIMKNKTFNDNYLTQGFKNARNTVAGLFNSKEPNPFLMDVDYVRYGIVNSEFTKSAQLMTLEQNTLPIVPYTVITKGSITVELLNHYRELWSKTYKIDGLVIEVDKAEYKGEYESNGNPSFAKAIKLPEWSVSAVVNVLSMSFYISKQGKLKPVINIEPTDIDGVVVSNVTGYNCKYILDNCIADGGKIEIIRSGDVIPKHISTKEFSVDNLEELMDSLVECPVCGEPTVWDDNFTEMLCTNPKCKGMILSKLEHFFSSLEFVDFSGQRIEQLYNEGVEYICDYFHLVESDLTGIKGWGKPMANNLLKQVDKLTNEGVCLAKLLAALDVFDGKIGEKDCQLILDNLITEDIKDWKTIPVNSLTSISGIGDVKAQAFISGINKYFSELFNILPIKVTYIKSPQVEQKGQLFKDMSVCVTGFRDGIIDDFVKSQGGKMVSGVSKKTNMLIVEDINTTSTKATKAREYGCRIVSRFEVEQMMNENI